MKRLFDSINTKYLAVCAGVAAFALTLPGVAMATESEAAKVSAKLPPKSTRKVKRSSSKCCWRSSA